MANFKIIPVGFLLEQIGVAKKKTDKFGYSDDLISNIGFILILCCLLGALSLIGLLLYKLLKKGNI